MLKMLWVFLSALTLKAEDLSKSWTWHGFLDVQYAYDANAPGNGDRPYTTQPARANEFNLNLAYIDANLDSNKLRSRLALQAGTSVQSNYSSEPQRGQVSGGDLSRHVQEAKIGYRVGDATWLDAGIFFGHLGAESFISRDNLVLTRSLVADYSPYYFSGAKLSRRFNDRFSGLLVVVNGWQNVSENNTDKSAGTGLEYAWGWGSLNYNTLFGNEVSPDLDGQQRKGQFRHFHDLIFKARVDSTWEFVAQLDLGFQQKADQARFSDWMGWVLMSRYALNPTRKISLRLEQYRDADQVILVTSEPVAFSAFGGSVGFDEELEKDLVWRSEARYLKADNDVFPKGGSKTSDDNLTLTTSLALSL